MLTAALQHMDKNKKLDIQVYEAAPFLAEIGAGINLWLRSWEILRAIDLEETFVRMMDEALAGATSALRGAPAATIIILGAGEVALASITIYRSLIMNLLSLMQPNRNSAATTQGSRPTRRAPDSIQAEDGHLANDR